VELSILMRLRIAAAVAIGAVIIGYFAWPIAQPQDPYGVVSFIAGNMARDSALKLAALAVLCSILAFFISWPYGRYLAILAVPSGLAVWALRSGNMAELMRQNPTAAERLRLFSQIKWEPFSWLAIVALGFLIAHIGQKFFSQNPAHDAESKTSSAKPNYITFAITLGVSVLLAKVLLLVFAENVKIADDKIGDVIVQVTAGQTIFAILVSFGIVAFLVKKFLDISYICPIVATALVQPAVIAVYLKPDVMKHIVEYWPAVFYSNAIVCILPVQMVAFGTLGSIAGYWLAVRYDYWRTHES
jgi:hypothetical protein